MAIPEQVTAKNPRDKVLAVIQPHFDFDVSERVTVRGDLEQFNYLEDESVWEQARGLREPYYEVYWDDVWLCDFKESFATSELVYVFFKGFEREYSTGAITFEEPVITKRQDKQRDNLKKINKMSDATPEEALTKQALKELAEEEIEKRDKKVKEVERKK